MSSPSKLPLLVVAGLAVAVALIVGSPRRSPPPERGTGKGAVDSTAGTMQIDRQDTLPSPVDPGAGRVDDRTDALKSEFVYLFDVSTSTHPGAANDPFERAARALVPSIEAVKGDEMMLPARYRVGTIGAGSLMQEPLCDLRLEMQLIFAHRDTTLPNARLKACDLALRTHASEHATDIRGALHFAALTLHGDLPIIRGILLATDLEEALQPGQIGATPDLRGICVAVLSIVTPAAVPHPDSLAAREQRWGAQLRQWGATRVRVQSILGFDAGDLHAFFRSCPPSHSP